MAKRKTYKEGFDRGYEIGVKDVLAEIIRSDYINISADDLIPVAEVFKISREELKVVAAEFGISGHNGDMCREKLLAMAGID